MRLLALPTNRIPFPTFPRVAPGVQGFKSFPPWSLAASPWALGPVSTGRRLPGWDLGIVALACLVVTRVDVHVHVSTLSFYQSSFEHEHFVCGFRWVVEPFSEVLCVQVAAFSRNPEKRQCQSGGMPTAPKAPGTSSGTQSRLPPRTCPGSAPHSSLASRSAMGVKTQAWPTLRLINSPRASRSARSVRAVCKATP